MKNGKKPTLRQKKLMAEWGLNPLNWLVVKDTPAEMIVVHRFSDGSMRRIPKG